MSKSTSARWSGRLDGSKDLVVAMVVFMVVVVMVMVLMVNKGRALTREWCLNLFDRTEDMSTNHSPYLVNPSPTKA